MQGSVINTRPRRHIPILLYIQLALYVPETCLSILGIYWAFYDSKGCDDGLTIPVKITVVLQWGIFLTVLAVAIVFFDPLGSSHITGGAHDIALQEKTTKVILIIFLVYGDPYHEFPRLSHSNAFHL